MFTLWQYRSADRSWKMFRPRVCILGWFSWSNSNPMDQFTSKVVKKHRSLFWYFESSLHKTSKPYPPNSTKHPRVQKEVVDLGVFEVLQRSDMSKVCVSCLLRDSFWKLAVRVTWWWTLRSHALIVELGCWINHFFWSRKFIGSSSVHTNKNNYQSSCVLGSTVFLWDCFF